MNDFNTKTQGSSPYVEDKALTWTSLSAFGKLAVSAGTLAVGAMVAQPMLPAFAAIVAGFNTDAPRENTADSQINLQGATPNGLALPNPAGIDGLVANAPGSSTSVVTSSLANASTRAQGTGSNSTSGNSVSAGSSGTKSSNGNSSILANTKLNFGNVSSATPSAGTSGSTSGSTWSGKGEGREGGEHELSNGGEGGDD